MTKSLVITKDMIEVAAFEVARRLGVEALTARNIAKELKCSTQPIYNTHGNMEAVKEITMTKLIQFTMSNIVGYKKTGRTFLDSGLGYINFAKEEKVLFQAFEFKMQYHCNGELGPGNSEIRKLMEADECVKQYNLSEESKDKVFLQTMIFTYGLAVLNYLERLEMSEDEVAILLEKTCEGYCEQEAKGKKDE